MQTELPAIRERIPSSALVVIVVSFAGFTCLGLPDGTMGMAWPSVRDGFARVQSDFGLVLLAHGASYFVSACSARGSIVGSGRTRC